MGKCSPELMYHNSNSGCGSFLASGAMNLSPFVVHAQIC